MKSNTFLQTSAIADGVRMMYRTHFCCKICYKDWEKESGIMGSGYSPYVTNVCAALWLVLILREIAALQKW